MNDFCEYFLLSNDGVENFFGFTGFTRILFAISDYTIIYDKKVFLFCMAGNRNNSEKAFLEFTAIQELYNFHF